MQTSIEVIQGDLTKCSTEAIVNAANTSLLGGGGVDGAIHRAGGQAILNECMAIRAKQGGCNTGEAVITTGGNLPARYVIHTVGPVWNGGSNHEEELLRNAYWNSLVVAVAHQIKSIAFPNISTGIYHFPKELAAKIAQDTVKAFIDQHPDTLERVVFVCFDDENYNLYA